MFASKYQLWRIEKIISNAEKGKLREYEENGEDKRKILIVRKCVKIQTRVGEEKRRKQTENKENMKNSAK